VDPISTGLAGIALVQKSVDFIKSNIQTANDIKDIAGAIDGLFQGEKQIQKDRFGDKSIIGQTKDVATSVIDAKLAQESMDEMRQLVDARFGFGTWQEIINERAKRIQEEKEAEKERARIARQKRQETVDNFQTAGIAAAIIGVVILTILIYFKLG
tara:strand:+ start:392 stop:859 length:468 start_codon:yes stop_codon:yes gene_type:complete